MSSEFVSHMDTGFDDVFPASIPPPMKVTSSQFLLTKSGIKFSRTANVFGKENVKIEENCVINSEAIIRADLRRVEIGSYVYLDTRSILRPFCRLTPQQGLTYFPIKIGNYVYISHDTIVEAATIGNCVVIESGVTLGARCQLSSVCKILKGSVVMPDTVVPSYCVYGGNPAVFVKHLHEGAKADIMDLCSMMYDNIVVDAPASATTPSTSSLPVNANTPTTPSLT
eukprot:PhM_4_TR9637/c0_g1_i1/m.105284/K10427/DCTN5; dynactin 5